jgi:hypothetical protein
MRVHTPAAVPSFAARQLIFLSLIKNVTFYAKFSISVPYVVRPRHQATLASGSAICGIAFLPPESIYVVTQNDLIEVFTSQPPYERVGSIELSSKCRLSPFSQFLDITACPVSRRLYVVERDYASCRSSIRSVSPHTDSVHEEEVFCAFNGNARSLSVNSDKRRLLVTVVFSTPPHRLLRYSTVNAPEDNVEIDLPEHVYSPWHAIETQNNTFVVCQTGADFDKQNEKVVRCNLYTARPVKIC